jgi:hypothetical protein
MKRLLHLSSLFLLAVPVSVATGCNVEPEMRRCVDFRDHVLNYHDCERPVSAVRVAGSLNPLPSHRWYFGGYGGAELGASAWGGSDTALRGHAYRPAGADLGSEMTAAAVRDSPQPYVSGVR